MGRSLCEVFFGGEYPYVDNSNVYTFKQNRFAHAICQQTVIVIYSIYENALLITSYAHDICTYLELLLITSLHGLWRFLSCNDDVTS